MKVKELIETLELYNPELEVCVYDSLVEMNDTLHVKLDTDFKCLTFTPNTQLK